MAEAWLMAVGALPTAKGLTQSPKEPRGCSASPYLLLTVLSSQLALTTGCIAAQSVSFTIIIHIIMSKARISIKVFTVGHLF